MRRRLRRPLRLHRRRRRVRCGRKAWRDATIVTGRRGVRQPSPQSNMPVAVAGPVRHQPYTPSPDNRERYDGEGGRQRPGGRRGAGLDLLVDVDTGSYANVRRLLNAGATPPQAAVRTEEMLNYFRYDYPVPQDRSRPFSITTDMTTTPWNANSRLLRVGLRGYDLPRRGRPPANLVFLVDVSGSMGQRRQIAARAMLAGFARQPAQPAATGCRSSSMPAPPAWCSSRPRAATRSSNR